MDRLQNPRGEILQPIDPQKLAAIHLRKGRRQQRAVRRDIQF